MIINKKLITELRKCIGTQMYLGDKGCITLESISDTGIATGQYGNGGFMIVDLRNCGSICIQKYDIEENPKLKPVLENIKKIFSK